MEKGYLAPAEIKAYCADVGVKKCHNKTMRLLVLGIFAGMFIALGAAGANMAIHSLPASLGGIKKLIAGAIFPVGLMLVIIAGGELFTGNNLITVALLEKKVTLKEMLNNWVLVYLGNFIGSIFVAWMIYESGLFNTSQGLLGELHINTALAKTGLTFSQAFIRGILCNILVALAVWMSFAATRIVDKIAAIWFPVMLFIVGGYEHCIANMYYIPAGIMAAGGEASGLGLTWSAFVINNLVPVTLGNIVGGGLIVGALYWYVYCDKEFVFSPMFTPRKELSTSKK
ncbi:MAG: formate/nitrite transporter family protein [Peptococcaceae bacterium]